MRSRGAGARSAVPSTTQPHPHVRAARPRPPEVPVEALGVLKGCESSGCPWNTLLAPRRARVEGPAIAHGRRPRARPSLRCFSGAPRLLRVLRRGRGLQAVRQRVPLQTCTHVSGPLSDHHHHHPAHLPPTRPTETRSPKQTTLTCRDHTLFAKASHLQETK